MADGSALIRADLPIGSVDGRRRIGHYACVAGGIVEDAEGWSLVDDQRRIDTIQLDFRFSLVLDDGTLVVIESPFTATVDGKSIDVAPETLEGVGSVLGVLHRNLASVRALRTGALHIELSDGGRGVVPPSEDYENWQVILPDGTQFIGLPGGGVAILPPA